MEVLRFQHYQNAAFQRTSLLKKCSSKREPRLGSHVEALSLFVPFCVRSFSSAMTQDLLASIQEDQTCGNFRA